MEHIGLAVKDTRIDQGSQALSYLTYPQACYSDPSSQLRTLKMNPPMGAAWNCSESFTAYCLAARVSGTEALMLYAYSAKVRLYRYTGQPCLLQGSCKQTNGYPENENWGT